VGIRRDRGLAVARYVVGASGIPGVRWTGQIPLDAPYPYQLGLTTSRVHVHWTDAIAELDPKRVGGIIKYDGSIPDIPSAMVGMRLDHFCSLIGMHYEQHVKGRGE
jgi:hypothetical protein